MDDNGTLWAPSFETGFTQAGEISGVIVERFARRHQKAHQSMEDLAVLVLVSDSGHR